MDKKLMKLFLECPNTVREVLLSKNQLSILKFIKMRFRSGIYARELANADNCSIQNASTQLNNLMKRGYLMRVQGYAESGGLEYRYSNLIDFKVKD